MGLWGNVGFGAYRVSELGIYGFGYIKGLYRVCRIQGLWAYRDVGLQSFRALMG